MSNEALKALAAKLSGGHNVSCSFAIRDAVADHGAVILEISTDDSDGIGLPLTREVAEEIAHQLVMPFRRAHLAREIARIMSECDDPSTDTDTESDHANNTH